MPLFSRTLTTLAFSTVFAASAAMATTTNHNITEADVKAAQDAWGKALIQISDDYQQGGFAKAKTTAQAVLDQAYGYDLGPVLFKPTLASGDTTFRTTEEGALAYFVGGNSQFPDKGFALKGWKQYQYKNAGVQIHGDVAITMGHVILTDKDGKVTMVDKTWGFKKDEKGQVRIVLHHSSLPYSAK